MFRSNLSFVCVCGGGGGGGWGAGEGSGEGFSSLGAGIIYFSLCVLEVSSQMKHFR